MQIPEDLKQAILRLSEVGFVSTSREDARKISGRYRDRASNLQIQSDQEALAYVTARMPATYAAARRALEIARAVIPDFIPKNILDIGAGPGTMAIAAAHEWGAMDAELNLIETNQYLERAGRGIFSDLGIKAQWKKENVTEIDSFLSHDLIAAGYVLNELGSDNHLESVVKKMWKAANGMVLIIEPGTPHGSEIVQKARDILIAEGAHIIAPCPQSGVCPVRTKSDQWCHFSVRLPRSRHHKNLKNAKLGYEDEKFSFIAAAKFAPVNRPSMRLIGHVRGSKVLNLPVCDENGNQIAIELSKRNPDFKKISKLEWGDGVVIN
jgi:ribosomal protein RSM22 (predicted rRNA methylase)